MHDLSVEGRGHAVAASLPLDPARFPFTVAVERAFRDRRVPLVRVAGPDAHRPAVYRVGSPEAEWDCLIEADEDRECVAIRSILPIEIPTGRRHEVAMLAAGVNSARAVGHFAIVRCGTRVTHTSGVRLAGLEPSGDALAWLLGENLLAVDLHLAAFTLVACGDFDPETALHACGPVAPEPC